MLTKNGFQLLLASISFLLLSTVCATNVPVKQKKGKTVIPFVSAYATSGPLAANGKKLLSGVKLYLQHKKLKTISLVHKGNIGRFGYNVSKKLSRLLKKTPLFLGVYGTRPFLSVISFLKKNKSVLLCPVEGSSLIRNKKKDGESSVYFRPPHKYELSALVDYVINNRMRSKISVFYEASMWGDSVLADLKKLLNNHNISILTESSYTEETINVANSVGAIADSNPNVVFCIASPRAAYNFIRRALNRGLHKALFVGLSNLQIIQQLLKSSRGMDIVVSSVLPDPVHSKVEIAKQYRRASEELLKGVPCTPSSFEGYVSTAILATCLKQLKGPITTEEVFAIMKKMQNTDVGGLRLTYFHDINALSTDIWVNPGVGKKWKLFMYKQERQ